MTGSRPVYGGADFAVVIPTLARGTLAECLRALAGAEGPPPSQITIVDDRPWRQAGAGDVELRPLGELRDRTTVVQTGGRGPAAARNVGWRTVHAPWVVFLDDDVRVTPTWRADLAADLSVAKAQVGAVQGVLEIPLARHRRPTDWERGTAGLAGAVWATADMAYRTAALRAVGGFDERFPRAFREDADLALRVIGAGWRIHRGTRRTEHPVRPADRWVSVRAQRGNADDALMAALHGPRWRARASAPRGRIVRHAAVTAAAGAALLLTAAGWRRSAALAAAGWALGTAEFAWARIAPGPRDRDETLTMLATSVLIPPLAVWHRLRGELRHGMPVLRHRTSTPRAARPARAPRPVPPTRAGGPAPRHPSRGGAV